MRGIPARQCSARRCCSADATGTNDRGERSGQRARLSCSGHQTPRFASRVLRGALMSPGAQSSQPSVWNIDTATRDCMGGTVNIVDTAPQCRCPLTCPSVQIGRAGELSDRDRLTGVCNRVQFDLALESKSEARSAWDMRSVLRCWISIASGTSTITFGHAAGDRVLVEVAARLLA